MAIKLSVGVRNARLDAIESTVGTSAVIKIFDGTTPSATSASDNGTVLATFNLPSDWANAASNGSKTLLGTWQDAAADATGTADYFRMYDSGESACHVQGTVTALSSGGDMELQQATNDIISGQQVTISTFTLTDANS